MACVVANCKSRMGSKGKQSEIISFHRFPNDKILRGEWIAAVSFDDDWTPRKHHRVCSKHFSASCFATTDKWRRLKHNAVPTLLLKHESIKSCKPTTFEPLKTEPSCWSTTTCFNTTSADIPMKSHMTSTNPQISSGSITSANSTLSIDAATYSSSFIDIHVDTNVSYDNCAVHFGMIDRLEKKIVVLQERAKKRLLKISSLRQCVRRLQKKNTNLNLRLIDIIEKE